MLPGPDKTPGLQKDLAMTPHSSLGLWTLDEAEGNLRQSMARLVVPTRGRRFHHISQPVNSWLKNAGAGDGLVTLFLRHTSASLTIQENTDPDVQADIVDALDRLAPERPDYRHNMEGADDMPAHIKTVLTGVNLQVPVIAGEMDLGTWQALYLVEHRDGHHQRTITLHYLGT